jgi:hypothetical protein
MARPQCDTPLVIIVHGLFLHFMQFDSDPDFAGFAIPYFKTGSSLFNYSIKIYLNNRKRFSLIMFQIKYKGFE